MEHFCFRLIVFVCFVLLGSGVVNMVVDILALVLIDSYSIVMTCPKCRCSVCTKNGIVRGLQRYKCFEICLYRLLSSLSQNCTQTYACRNQIRNSCH